MAEDLPRLSHLAPGRASVHGTAVAFGAEGVLITGPSGAGKSGLAAQVLALGAALIADDLTILSRQGAHVLVSAPPDAPAMLEARGLGLVPTPLHPPVALSAIVILAPSAARLPEPEHMAVLETPIPVLRHPYRFDLAAKLRLRPWRGM